MPSEPLRKHIPNFLLYAHWCRVAAHKALGGIAHPLTRRIARYTALICVALVGLVSVTVLFYGRQAQHQWSEYRQQAATRGVLIDLPQSASSLLPDSENLAASDGPFAKLFVKGDNSLPSEKWLADFDWVPLTAMPSLNKAKRGFTTALENNLQPAGLSSEEKGQSAQEFLATFDQRLGRQWSKILEAEAKPKTHYGISYAPWHQNGRVPYLVFRKAMQLHALRTVALLELGRDSEALVEVQRCFRLARALAESGENHLVGMMLEVALTRLSLEPVWAGLVGGHWSDEELASLQEQLSNVHPSKRWSLAIDTERAWLNTILDQLAAKSIVDRPKAIRDLIGSHRKYPILLLSSTSGVIRESQIAANCWMDAAREQIDEHGRLNATAPKVPEKYNFEKMNNIERMRYFFAQIGVPNTLRAASRTVSTEARVRQAQVAVALERYRRIHQQLPENLNLLVPTLLPKIPLDPFDGKPLRYSRDSAGTYRLWSIGDDLDDDGGLASPEENPGEMFDLVWPGGSV